MPRVSHENAHLMTCQDSPYSQHYTRNLLKGNRRLTTL